jgi:hypothetical protein
LSFKSVVHFLTRRHLSKKRKKPKKRKTKP